MEGGGGGYCQFIIHYLSAFIQGEEESVRKRKITPMFLCCTWFVPVRFRTIVEYPVSACGLLQCVSVSVVRQCAALSNALSYLCCLVGIAKLL